MFFKVLGVGMAAICAVLASGYDTDTAIYVAALPAVAAFVIFTLG